MLSEINILISILWVISAVIDYSNFCYIWQLKEYRLDRMRDFMSTKLGKRYWQQYALLWRSSIVIIVFFWPINDLLRIKYFLIIILTIDLAHSIFSFLKKRLKYPVFTKKAILTILLSLLFEGGLFIITRDWELIFLFLIIRFFVLSFFVILLKIPTKLLKHYFINKAAAKLKKYKNLTVIGITGSFGKTSVKTFLTHILESKYRVIKTPKNINTEIGIAQFILKTNFENIDVFVIEMGAYKIGDIKLICDMVKPAIGILTAINEQHLSLFGSMENIQKAKYELLESLPNNGLAITNLDNRYCTKKLAELNCKVRTFGYDEENKPTCLITEVKIDHGKILIKFKFKEGDVWEVLAPICGEHNAQNLAACVLAAEFLNVSKELIIKQIQSLKVPEGVLRVYKYGKATIIDDSYNSNPDGFRSAIDTLNNFPSEKKRIVITRGLLELGDKTEEIHEQIGGEVAYVADEFVIITPDSAEAFIKGVGKKYRTNIVLKYNPKDLLSYVKKLKNKNAVILLENRLPKIVYEEIKDCL